jgi:acetyl-CoA carboxylase biotin carboxylase subunit
VDTFVEDGAVISPYYDSLVAKVIVWDADRPAAIARARRALAELVIEGITTTADFASGVLDSRAFRSGEYSTSFLAEQVALA